MATFERSKLTGIKETLLSRPHPEILLFYTDKAVTLITTIIAVKNNHYIRLYLAEAVHNITLIRDMEL